MNIWEKTHPVSKKRKLGIRLGLGTVLAAGLFYCANTCFHSDGAIPLSMSMAVSDVEPAFPAEQAVEAPFLQVVPDLDAELVALLQQSTIVPVVAEEVKTKTVRTVDAVDTEMQQPRWKKVRMRVTGYCMCPKCCGSFSDGYTANMHKIRKGDRFVAADKRVPFGTEMIIPGYNSDRPVKVKDRGRLIKGNRLDVFFNDHKVAHKWGTRYLDVMVKVDD